MFEFPLKNNGVCNRFELNNMLNDYREACIKEIDRLNNFINELNELTKKYNLIIGGCGCCGSPWIEDLQEEYEYVENVTYDVDNEKYTYEYNGEWYR